MKTALYGIAAAAMALAACDGAQNGPADAAPGSSAAPDEAAKKEGTLDARLDHIRAAFRDADDADLTRLSKEIETLYIDRKKEISERFFAQNQTRDGVVTTESGLQYEILQEGEGPRPTRDDKVRVVYRGGLLNGHIFDATEEGAEPTLVGVSQTIDGWVEGLQLMREGGVYRLYVPWSLGYGERGNGMAGIGPYESLIFEVELVDVIKPDVGNDLLVEPDAEASAPDHAAPDHAAEDAAPEPPTPDNQE